MSYEELSLIHPLLIVALTAGLVLVADLVQKGKGKEFAFIISLLGLLVALFTSLVGWDDDSSVIFNGLYTVDRLGSVFDVIFLVAAVLTVLLSWTYMKRTGVTAAEYYVLLLCTLMGMMIMAHANDLILLFVGLELLSIPLYVLAAFLRQRSRSTEAGLKYFLLGAFASCIVLYGIALLYGAAGSTQLPLIAAEMGTAGSSFLFMAGLAFVIAGLGFKVAAVPFHMWAPDVYEGAPTPITAFMATAVKAAGFAALVRAFHELAGAFDSAAITGVISAIALLTMLIGNLGALPQTNIKRLLAYSSIAHAGYILVGVAAMTASTLGKEGAEAVLFYLLAYTFTNLGAFAVVIFLIGQKEEYNEISDLAGLSRKHPVLALSMAVFMFTLTGIPPTAGFFGKFLLFKAAVDADLIVLAVAGILMSVISLYYYVRVVAYIYMRPSRGETPVMDQSSTLAIVSLISVAGVLLLGIFPQPLLNVLKTVFLA